MKNCSLFVMPSRYEGQPVTTLEAAAFGKPIIVSDIPELGYVVDAGFGLSFRTGDAEDLARKIDYLMANEQLRQEMGRRAKEYARHFTWDRVADQYERFLMDVADRAKGSRR
jgi:glycosyltransferase involved in cell wall biosynthesis